MGCCTRGFGNRGIEGMIETIKYVRENKIPFLGICLGMQMTAVEYARNVLNLKMQIQRNLMKIVIIKLYI